MKFNLPMQELDIVPEFEIDREALEKTAQSNKEYKLTCKVSKQKQILENTKLKLMFSSPHHLLSDLRCNNINVGHKRPKC